jgi:hypothetical protein
LVIPALALDLGMKRFRGSDWLLAPALGLAFVASMAAIHWPWSDFLLSPAARNFVFAADQWDYNIEPGPWRYEYWTLQRDASGSWDGTAFLSGLGVAALVASASTRLGLWVGRGMARVQR